MCNKDNNFVELPDDQYLLPMYLNIPGPSSAVGGGHMLWSLWDTEDIESRSLNLNKLSHFVLSKSLNCDENFLIINKGNTSFIIYKGIGAIDGGREIGSIVLLKIDDTTISSKNVYDFDHVWQEDEYLLEAKFTFDYDPDLNVFLINENKLKKKVHSSEEWMIADSKEIKIELF